MRAAGPDLAVLMDCEMCVLQQSATTTRHSVRAAGPDLAVLMDCEMLCVLQQSATTTRHSVRAAGPDLAVADTAVLFLHPHHLESDSRAVPSLPHTGTFGIAVSQSHCIPSTFGIALSWFIEVHLTSLSHSHTVYQV